MTRGRSWKPESQPDSQEPAQTRLDVGRGPQLWLACLLGNCSGIPLAQPLSRGFSSMGHGRTGVKTQLPSLEESGRLGSVTTLAVCPCTSHLPSPRGSA